MSKSCEPSKTCLVHASTYLINSLSASKISLSTKKRKGILISECPEPKNYLNSKKTTLAVVSWETAVVMADNSAEGMVDAEAEAVSKEEEALEDEVASAVATKVTAVVMVAARMVAAVVVIKLEVTLEAAMVAVAVAAGVEAHHRGTTMLPSLSVTWEMLINATLRTSSVTST